jgi:hypothetical protein
MLFTDQSTIRDVILFPAMRALRQVNVPTDGPAGEEAPGTPAP